MSERPEPDPNVPRGHLKLVAETQDTTHPEEHEAVTSLVFSDLEDSRCSDEEIARVTEDIIFDDLSSKKLRDQDGLGYALILTRAILSELHIEPTMEQLAAAMEEEERRGEHDKGNDETFTVGRDIEKSIAEAVRLLEDITERNRSYAYSTGLAEYFIANDLMDLDVMRVAQSLYESTKVPTKPKLQIPVARRIIMTMIWTRRGKPELPSPDL